MFRGLLIWHSSYFAAALDPSNRLLEGKDDALELEGKEDAPKLDSKDDAELERKDNAPRLDSKDDAELESKEDVEPKGEDDALELEVKFNALELRSKGNTLELEEEIEVFDVFYCWLYTGQLKDAFISQDPTTPQPKSADDVYLPDITLCKIWVFADFRGIPALGNAAINMLHERIISIWKTPSEIIKYIYGHTAKGSNLREFLVHFYTRAVGVERVLSLSPENFTVEFTLELLAIFAKMKFGATKMSRSEWTKVNRCQWHDHSGPGGKLRLENRG